MLPCNVIVYEGDEGRAVVAASDQSGTVAAQGAPALQQVAASVREKLQRVIGRLE